MAQLKLKGAGAALGTSSTAAVIRAMAQQHARVVCAGIAATTDNSTGVAVAAGATLSLPAAFVDVAATGSDLAGLATTEAAFTTVKNGIAVAAQKGNALTALLQALTLIDNTGGTIVTPGTIPATTKTVTGAATGAVAASLNATRASINAALYSVIRQANQIARAVGVAPIKLSSTEAVANTLAVITVSGGVAASPGVTKASVDAALTAYANILASLAVIYNAARTNTLKVRVD